MIQFKLKINKKDSTSKSFNQLLNEIKSSNQSYSYDSDSSGNMIIWLGDFIPYDSYKSISELTNSLMHHFSYDKILSTGGYFYCFIYSRNDNQIKILTSFLNILPIYIYENSSEIVFSSSIDHIYKGKTSELSISKQFILEKLLFNYSFRNNTFFNEIKLLPANSFIIINKFSYVIKKITDVLELVIKNPKSSGKSLKDITTIFEQRMVNYLPSEQYSLSFTSGFDGRTLLGLALKYSSDFLTYSFGSSNSDDITIPQKQSRILKLNYKSIILDSENYLNKSLESGLELVNESYGMANFARAHYVYSIKELSSFSNFLITGNFGSELFRAFHNTGVMISPFLYHLLIAKDIKNAFNNYHFNELKFLNSNLKNHELSILKQSIIDDELFNSKLKLNIKFYKYIFEEVFRKYFGPEITIQTKYFTARTPFLDYIFIKKLFETNFAGIYQNFYEKNPIKRYLGQLLYANVIKNNNKDLYKLKTAKGYSPRDLLTLEGKVKIIYHYVNKLVNKKNSDKDVFAVDKAFKHNVNFFKSLSINNDYFLNLNEKNILNANTLINYYSLIWLMQEKYGK